MILGEITEFLVDLRVWVIEELWTGADACRG